MNKVLSLVGLVGISLMSCEKPELSDPYAHLKNQPSENVVNVDDKSYFNEDSKTSKTSKTSKSNSTIEYTIEVVGEQDKLVDFDGNEVKHPMGFQMYQSNEIEFDSNDDTKWRIVAHTNYYVDQMNSLVVSTFNESGEEIFHGLFLEGEYQIIK